MGAELHRVTSSGAKIAPVSVEAAEAFLARVGERGPDEIWIALAALKDDESMIGIAVLGASVSDEGRAMVAISPEYRRLQIGTDLLHALGEDAHARGLRFMRIGYRADATTVDALVRSSGLMASREVANGLVTAVLFTAR